MTYDDLIGAVLGIPDLPDAACRGEHELYDLSETDPAAEEDAIQLCQACPCMIRRRNWVTSLPPRKRPPGITAGMRNPFKTRAKGQPDEAA